MLGGKIKSQPLLDGASDQIYVAAVGVKPAHELIQPLRRRPLVPALVQGDGRLQTAAQNGDASADKTVNNYLSSR